MKKVFTLFFSLVFTVLQVQAQFTAGNIVVLRSNSTVTGTVTLAEYTTSGVPGITVTVPNSVAGARLTIDGDDLWTGQLNLSADKHYLTFVGYDLATGQGFTAQNAATTNKAIGRVDRNGTVDVSTQIPVATAFASINMRGAVTNDGSAYYVTGGGTTGLQYITHGANPTATQISANNYRTAGIFQNYLLVSAGGSMAHLGQLPTGATSPTSLGLSNNASHSSNNQIVMLDMDGAVSWNGTGLDVLYIGDATSGNIGVGLSKYYWNGTNAWVFAGISDVTGATQAITGLTGSLVGGVPTLYGVKGNGVGTSIISIVDGSGRTGNIATTPPTTTTIVTAAANIYFKGVAFAPSEGTIPVELASFKGSLMNDKAALQWITASELNVKEFIVEKSGDTKTFTTIGKVAARNTNAKNSYDFDDIQLNKDINYYRLKMVDNDGSFKYSHVIAIKSDSKTAKAFGIFPNPVTHQVTVNHAAAAEGALIKIVSINGSTVAQYPVAKDAIQTSIDAAQLPKGQYFINYVSKGVSITSSFIK